jgi:hypothetical protein
MARQDLSVYDLWYINDRGSTPSTSHVLHQHYYIIAFGMQGITNVKVCERLDKFRMIEILVP